MGSNPPSPTKSKTALGTTMKIYAIAIRAAKKLRWFLSEPVENEANAIKYFRKSFKEEFYAGPLEERCQIHECRNTANRYIGDGDWFMICTQCFDKLPTRFISPRLLDTESLETIRFPYCYTVGTETRYSV